MSLSFNGIKKRTLVKIISFSSVFFIFLIGISIYSTYQLNKYKFALSCVYQRSLGDLNDYMNNIDTELRKSMYAGSAKQFGNIASNLWQESSCAKISLSNIPTGDNHIDNVNKFLSQVGDYAMALSKKSKPDDDLSPDMINQLEKLCDYSAKLKTSIADLTLEYQNGRPLNELDFLAGDYDANSGMKGIEESFNDYPTFIYDGPFSDNILEKESVLLKKSTEISNEKAKQTAKEFLNLTDDNFEDCENEHGNFEAYNLCKDSINISVTKRGGYVSYMLNHRERGDSKFTAGQAISAADMFIRNKVKGSFKMTGYECSDDTCTISYACTENNTTIYPDLIKIEIALDNGEVIAYDARGYINNHKIRSNLKASKTQQEAQKIVSTQLKIMETNLVVIPSSGTEEKLCYEFKCKSKREDTVLVYINANNLTEEKILIVIENEQSKLTI